MKHKTDREKLLEELREIPKDFTMRCGEDKWEVGRLAGQAVAQIELLEGENSMLRKLAVKLTKDLKLTRFVVILAAGAGIAAAVAAIFK